MTSLQDYSVYRVASVISHSLLLSCRVQSYSSYSSEKKNLYSVFIVISIQQCREASSDVWHPARQKIRILM